MKKMKFGLALPYGSARMAVNLVKQAEENGWDGCFLGDAVWTEDPMIRLAAAATVTSEIKLGTMVIPVPLRRPWKIASESVALDRLSNGRLILGLGTGAVWMGWQGFPDEVTDTRARAEMLSETVEILTKLYQRKPFDYTGKHYTLKLTLVDEVHYPPKPVQQPRIPIWAPGIWPRRKSMRRVLACDGLLPLKMSDKGEFEQVETRDLVEMKAFIDANRTLTTPFDYVVEGKLSSLDMPHRQEMAVEWSEAGATWFVESLWEANEETSAAYIQQGPPDL
jgi:hypothetical protein